MPVDDVQFEKLTQRVHKMSDMVQAHEGTIREHGVLINFLNNQLETVRQTTATREALDNAIGRVTTMQESNRAQLTASLESSEKTLSLKLNHLHDDMVPIKRGIYWVVGLILAALIGAGMTFILRGGFGPV